MKNFYKIVVNNFFVGVVQLTKNQADAIVTHDNNISLTLVK